MKKNFILSVLWIMTTALPIYSTVFQMDILLIWNFRHLANINKEQKNKKSPEIKKY
jgi:hypothetical protein